jgi:CubicO group peptidase (beta-lactamase class C family)
MFMNNGSSLVHPDSIAEMRKETQGVVPYENPNSNTSTPSPTLLSYGLIWNWRKLRNRQRYIGHGGSILGATHSMLVNEQRTVGIILLTNADTYPDNDSSMRIRATLEDIQMSLFACFET